MLKYAGYDIVFQEIPDEVTLALNLSGRPNGCPGCHSPHLQRDEGEALTPGALERLLERYGREITCVCFMGGDAAPGEVAALARHIARTTGGTIRTGWYSGRPALPPEFDPLAFDYVKLGPYREKLGGLNCRTTNQRLYRIVRTGSHSDGYGSPDDLSPNGGTAARPAESLFRMTDITSRFWRR